MDGTAIKEQLIAQLQTLPVCKSSSNRRNWVVRCPYCGDSKHSNHGHFSILIDVNSDTPILYRCFKCNESGLFTPQQAEDLGLGYDKNLTKSLDLYNRTASSRSYFQDKVKNFYVPQFEESAENLRKLDYINRRLGIQMQLTDCATFKIILSFKEFLKANHIPLKQSADDPSMLKYGTVNELDAKYVGFLSANNNKIIFRDITDSGFFGRYYKITLDLMNRSPNSFYSFLSQFNLLYTEPIEIHIAEGAFDIMGVYFNLPHEYSQNSLYFGNGGYGFGTILKYLIYTGVTTDVNLHIYSDADKTDADHLRLLSKPLYQTWIDHVYVHRNAFSGEKDFGVPKSRIVDYRYELKI